MKYFLAIFLLLALSTQGFAVLINIPTEKLISDSDIVVVGTLTEVTEYTWDGIDHSTGVISISQVVAGNVRSLGGKQISSGDQIIVKWEKATWFPCAASMHKSAVNVEGIWILNVEVTLRERVIPGSL